MIGFLQMISKMTNNDRDANFDATGGPAVASSTVGPASAEPTWWCSTMSATAAPGPGRSAGPEPGLIVFAVMSPAGGVVKSWSRVAGPFIGRAALGTLDQMPGSPALRNAAARQSGRPIGRIATGCRWEIALGRHRLAQVISQARPRRRSPPRLTIRRPKPRKHTPVTGVSIVFVEGQAASRRRTFSSRTCPP